MFIWGKRFLGHVFVFDGRRFCIYLDNKWMFLGLFSVEKALVRPLSSLGEGFKDGLTDRFQVVEIGLLLGV
jgi:hypothetical protein